MISDDRYKQIMAGLGRPDSHSLLGALQQVANEVAQKCRADAADLEDAADKARARASMSDLKWQRVSHDKEALQDQIEACRPYLKDGETVADCLARNRADISMLMGKWGAEKMTTARLRTALDKIAQTTGSDDPCRPLVQIARDALKRRSEAAGWQPTSTDPTHWMPLPAAPTTKEAT